MFVILLRVGGTGSAEAEACAEEDAREAFQLPFHGCWVVVNRSFKSVIEERSGKSPSGITPDGFCQLGLSLLASLHYQLPL